MENAGCLYSRHCVKANLHDKRDAARYAHYGIYI